MAQVPVLDPLVEGGILDVPAGPADLQRRAPGHLARPLPHDGETPRAGGLPGFRDHGPDHPNLSRVGVQGLDIVLIPELDLLLALGIVVDVDGSAALP